MEKQLEDMEQVQYILHIFTQNSLLSVSLVTFLCFWCLSQKGLNCRLAERDTFIITIIQNAMMEGRIQKTTFQGDAIVESLDPDTVTKLLHYLELTNQVTRFKQDMNND